MKGENEAMEIFKLVKQGKRLPAKMDELVPLSFIGQTAVSFYRQKIKLMDQLNMTEEQRKATLADGQDAGEMLLDIESRIGELVEKEPPAQAKSDGTRFLPSGKRRKDKRLGIDNKRMYQAQTIHKHPEVVERVKAKAKENEDIPTKTAVMSEIKLQKTKARLKKELDLKQSRIKKKVGDDKDLQKLAQKCRDISDEFKHLNDSMLLFINDAKKLSVKKIGGLEGIFSLNDIIDFVNTISRYIELFGYSKKDIKKGVLLK